MEKVLFTSDLSAKGLIKIFDALGVKLEGNVAVKLHSGEEGNQNYLRPEFVESLVNHVNGTVVECNTAYEGARNTTDKHEALMEKHGWSKYFKVDIMDRVSPDLVLDIPNGQVIKKNYVGANLANYDSMLVLSHFKGHPMAGYGGALKQLSIGIASSHGKGYIHCLGKEDWEEDDMYKVEQIKFIEAMADAALSVVNYFQDKKVVYINVMCNMSVDCDCCHKAEDPCMADIGILASTDPVAIDQACLDLVFNSSDPGKEKLIARIDSRKGRHIIDASVNLGIGSKEYELVNID